MRPWHVKICQLPDLVSLYLLHATVTVTVAANVSCNMLYAVAYIKCYRRCVWTSAWQQHDVQELCRAMFDALEQTWQNTKQSNVINELYEGKMKDCVQCLEVLT